MDKLLESVLPDTLAGFFVIAVALIMLSTIVVKYVMYKSGKSTTVEHINDVLDKDTFFNFVDDVLPVIQAERRGGRQASRAKIIEIIRSKIREADNLDNRTKSLLLTMDVSSFLVDSIERELIRRELIPAETESEEEEDEESEPTDPKNNTG